MKKLLHKNYLRIPAAAVSIVLILTLVICSLQTLRFRLFTNTLFREQMESDTLSMHYTIARPEKYGISPDHAQLPVYCQEAQAQSYRDLESYIKTAKSILPGLPAKDSRRLLILLTQYLEAQKREQAFPYYAEPLSPGSGIQSSLPILLAEYTFRTKQDVENYLSILSQIPPYLSGITAYEKEKAAAGLFMSDTSADQVIEPCYQIMDTGKQANDTHFLNTTFAERMRTLVVQNVITREEAVSYLERNHTLLLESVAPAYETLGDQILLLKGSGTNEMGLAHLPAGREYYVSLLAQTTACSRSIEELKQILSTQLQKDTQELAQILREHPGLLSLSLDAQFPARNPEAYLRDLQQRTANDFPAMPKSSILPSCTVKQVSKSLEDYCSPAFYLTPPIDDISENSVYINEKDNPGSLELYTTLAHEGYPGHLYQTVFYQLYQQKNHVNPARNLLHYGGYTEGWALYTEMYSYEYAVALLQENNAPQDALLLVEAMRLNRSIQLCLYSLLDLSIHYDGADYEKVLGFLNKFGIADPDLARNIYDYIVQEPANYPKYYVGYLEIEMLKETARQKWGVEYTDQRFHTMILESGPCPFSVLWEELS